MIRFREATRADLPEVVALLADDFLGAGREGTDMAPYFAAFDRMAASGTNRLIVGTDDGGRVVACYQIALIPGISLGAALRAQVEGVRVVPSLRGRGIGAALMADAEARAREAGCALVQLTTNRLREDAHRFYEREGYEASHLGFKKRLG